MKNIEIKVRVSDRALMLNRIRKLRAKKIGVLKQIDTYFAVPNGRLKLREEKSPDRAYLVFYSRPNRTSSRLCEYEIQNIAKPDVRKIRSLLTKALPVRVIVKKERTLFKFHHTRIHLDRVSGLGNFLELETVITDQKMRDAKREHTLIVHSLGLDACEKIPVSYSDLLIKKA